MLPDGALLAVLALTCLVIPIWNGAARLCDWREWNAHCLIITTLSARLFCCANYTVPQTRRSLSGALTGRHTRSQ